MAHKRKIIVNGSEYFYHISRQTICIWCPDNKKIVINKQDIPYDAYDVNGCRCCGTQGLGLHPKYMAQLINEKH